MIPLLLMAGSIGLMGVLVLLDDLDSAYGISPVSVILLMAAIFVASSAFLE